MWPHWDGCRGGAGGTGPRREQPDPTSSCQDELWGERSVQRADAHITAADVSHQQSPIQEHAREGEKSHSDAGHCARWVEAEISWGNESVNVTVTHSITQAAFREAIYDRVAYSASTSFTFVWLTLLPHIPTTVPTRFFSLCAFPAYFSYLYYNKSSWNVRLRVHCVGPDSAHTVAPDTAFTRSNYQPGCLFRPGPVSSDTA